MTISVIIPVYNEETILAQSLSRLSLLGFDEIVIADGGSTDRSVAVAEACCSRMPNARLVSAPLGRGRQMNAGARAARGQVLLFLHADTALPRHGRQTIEQALHDRAVVWGRFDVAFDSASPWARMIGTLMNLRSRWSGIATGDHALFVRRETFERMGGFADIPLMEDIEITRRLKGAGRMAALPDTVVTSFRRWERHGALRTIGLMWTLRFLYWLGVDPVLLHRWYRVAR
jgi:rSAM/selenodomain-associated transferase 2